MGANTIIDNNLHHNQETLDSFEFFQGGLSKYYSEENMMSHAEDIIFGGKLIPMNQQPLEKSEKHFHPLARRRSRSLSRSHARSTIAMGPLVGSSRSSGYKKLKRNSSAADINNNSGKQSCSSRRHVFMFGLVNVPQPEMNIRDLKSRQDRLNSLKTSIGSSESVDVIPASRSVDHRKSSWKVLDFLSCKSSSGAVLTPLSYMAKV